jgi:hypothetical protein
LGFNFFNSTNGVLPTKSKIPAILLFFCLAWNEQKTNIIFYIHNTDGFIQNNSKLTKQILILQER